MNIRTVYPVIRADQLSTGDLIKRVCNRWGEPTGPVLNHRVRALELSVAPDLTEIVTIQHGSGAWQTMSICADTLVQLEITHGN